jgi:hypothetical protein
MAWVQDENTGYYVNSETGQQAIKIGGSYYDPWTQQPISDGAPSATTEDYVQQLMLGQQVPDAFLQETFGTTDYDAARQQLIQNNADSANSGGLLKYADAFMESPLAPLALFSGLLGMGGAFGAGTSALGGTTAGDAFGLETLGSLGSWGSGTSGGALTFGGGGMDIFDFWDPSLFSDSGFGDFGNWAPVTDLSSQYSGQSPLNFGSLSNILGGTTGSLPSGSLSLLNSLLGGSGSQQQSSMNSWLPLLGLLGGGLLGGLTSGDQTQKSSTSTIPDEIKPYLGNLFSGAQGLLGGMTGAGGLGGQAQDMLQSTMAGNFQMPFQYNPYGNSFTPFTDNPYLGMTSPYAQNPYIGATTEVGSNPYFGMDNPYLQGVIDRSLGDVQSRVSTQFSNPNAFGGTAHQELLSRNLADASNQLRYQDYGLQAQLGEADVSRRLQAEMADLARNSQLQQQLGMFNSSLSQADLARNSQLAQNLGQFNANLYQTDLGRNANLFNTDMSRNYQMYDQERNRQFLSATGLPSFMNQWTTAQFSPYTQYANLLKGWGGTTTQTTPANTGADIFGGALTGYSLANMFNQPSSGQNLFSAFF